MKDLSTRSRLVLVVLLAALPVMTLMGYNTVAQRVAAASYAREDIANLARLAAEQQEQLIEGARQTLVALSLAPPEILHSQTRCNDYLAQVLKKSSGIYHSMGLYRADGGLYCNAMPWQGSINARDRMYFQLAMTSGKFSVGEYQIGKITKLQGINFGYPMLDAKGKVTSVAFVELDLERFNNIAADTPLPRGGRLAVVDHKGIILARYPETEGRVGQVVRNPRLLEKLTTAPRGVFTFRGSDDVDRLLAYDSVIQNPDGGLPVRVLVSIPLAVVYADANHELVRNLVGLLVATVLLLVGAWYGAEIFLLRSIRKLLDTTRRVRVGRLSARTGLIHGKDELAQLGSAFDEMMHVLQNREADLTRALHDVQQQAITDALTGLYNRRFLYDALPREIARARRKGKQVAVLMIDLDHFKLVNDTYGHEAGDLVLRQAAALIKVSVRNSDYCCRYGGEEITVVMPESEPEGTLLRAEAIRIAVQSLEVPWPGQKIIKITVSLGVAMFPDHGSDADSLLRAADEALYLAKSGGRNRVALHADVRPEVLPKTPAT